jgi:hypothetical protein
MRNKVLSISSTVQPDNRMDFNEWCRELNVSYNSVDTHQNTGLARGRAIMRDIRENRMNMAVDDDGIWSTIKGIIHRV